MGSKKHKKHKSERREKYEDRPFSLERPPSLKLILKVGGGNSSTPEYGSSESPVYGVQPENLGLLVDYPERHKKSKKKKKKKDREKKHKHHKEKRRNRDDSADEQCDNVGGGTNDGEDSSQEDFSVNEDSAQFQTASASATMDSQSPASVSSVRPSLLTLPMKSPDLGPFTPPSVPLMSEQSPSVSSVRSDSMKSPSSTSDASGREPRTCVLKLKQSKSPLSKVLQHLLRLMEKKDPHQFFAWPVTDDIAPGYSSIISNPMDFLTIRQKVDDNQYTSLQEFGDDFRLMCDNAIKYNHVETVYHRAAKRLLHIGMKMLQPENLMRTLRPLQGYMEELSMLELGFDMNSEHNQTHDNDGQAIDSADEGMSTGAEEINLAQLEEEEKRRNIRLENDPKTRFEPFVDDLTADEVLAQVQSAAKRVQQKVLNRKRSAAKMGFLRQRKDGTTSMQILVDADNSCPERVVSIGAFTGKLQSGTGQLQGLREDRRNNAKVVKPLNYGTFCSFAPVYDSRFANLSKEESELVLNTYGDDVGSEYTASILEFSKDSHHASTLANTLLDFLTNGKHCQTIATLSENARQKYDEFEIERTFPSTLAADGEKIKQEDVPIDFDSLRTLTDLGINVSFLNEMEEDIRTIEMYKKMQGKLQDNSALLERLNQVQHERLSQPLPAHLANIAHPNEDEIELATQITTNLTELCKQLPPGAIASPHGLRKAMGMTNVGLEPILPAAHTSHASTNGNGLNNTEKIVIDDEPKVTQQQPDIDITPVPMELEPELSGSAAISANTNSVGSMSTSQVDLESELREFLEGNAAGTLPTTDDVGIEQMLQ